MIQLDQVKLALWFHFFWLAFRAGKVKLMLGVIGVQDGPDPGLS